jgi:hypothetical protein
VPSWAINKQERFMKKLLFFLTLICSANYTIGQQPTYSKTFIDNYNAEAAYSIVKTDNNDYLIAGAQDNKALVLKLNNSVNILFDKTIGGNNNGVFNSIIPTRDSGYVLAGTLSNITNSTNNIFCVKINSDGDTLWTKEIDMGYNDYALSVQQTYDDGYIIAGYSGQNSMPHSMMTLVKLDDIGNLSWGETFSDTTYDSYAYAVKQMPDSGYVVIGYLDTLMDSGHRTLLMRLTSDGTISWIKKQVITASNYSWGCDMMTSGGCLICSLIQGNGGCSNILMKIDFSGNVIWSKQYYSNGDFGCGTLSLPKLHFLSDSVYTFISGNSLIKIDTAGNSIWGREYSLEGIFDFIETNDKGYMIIGVPDIVVKPPTYGSISVIKTDSLGNLSYLQCYSMSFVPTVTDFPFTLVPVSFSISTTASVILSNPVITNTSFTVQDGCVFGSIEESNADKKDIILYPNPATDKLNIENLQNGSIEILNIQGQTILRQSLKQDKTDIDIRGLAKGLYFLRLICNDKTKVTKFIKE